MLDMMDGWEARAARPGWPALLPTRRMHPAPRKTHKSKEERDRENTLNL